MSYDESPRPQRVSRYTDYSILEEVRLTRSALPSQVTGKRSVANIRRSRTIRQRSRRSVARGAQQSNPPEARLGGDDEGGFGGGDEGGFGGDDEGGFFGDDEGGFFGEYDESRFGFGGNDGNKERTISRYQEALKMRGSVIRLTAHFFLIEDWDAHYGVLNTDIYYHIFSMVDEDGKPVHSCNCPDHKTQNNCLHVSVFTSAYGEEIQLSEPIALEDDPPAVLLPVMSDSLVFSTTASSGGRADSTRRRAVVFCKAGEWHCQTCTRRGEVCVHVHRAKKHLAALREEDEEVPSNETLDASAAELVDIDSDEDMESTAIHSVSHMPIPPPNWCRLDSDTIPPIPAFEPPAPGVICEFFLDAAARCRCGSTQSDGSIPYTKEAILFTISRAVEAHIEVVDCANCSRRKTGPDLSIHGVFNWSNKVLFSHSLLNAYSGQFTASETPFSAFCTSMSREYIEHSSPIPFPSRPTFENAWFAFVKCQALEAPMKCAVCGDTPHTVIADGISLGHATKHSTNELHPPTKIDHSLVVRMARHTHEISLPVTRDFARTIRKMISARDEAESIHQLEEAVFEVPWIRHCIKYYCRLVEFGSDIAFLLKELLLQLFSSDSILQLVPFRSIPLLKIYVSSGEYDSKLTRLIPAFGRFILALDSRAIEHPQFLQAMADNLATRGESCFSRLKHERERGNPLVRQSTAQHISLGSSLRTGACYGTPPLRRRPYYSGLDTGTKTDRGDGQCNKYYAKYAKRNLTGGIMAFWCTHLVCLGFHLMPSSEGRNDVFSALYCYWSKPPSTVIYDFACQLGTYCMSREPEFFKDTLFAIDMMHAKGHLSCSRACFLSTYVAARPELGNVNPSAAECGNSGLKRIRKSVSYMTEERAIILCYVYIHIWNRTRERLRLSKEKTDTSSIMRSRTLQTADQ